MKKQLLILFTFISSINFYGQTSFEKGYFINNSEQKIDCLIKNIDWKNNPIEFEYKLSENNEIKIATIETTKEFGIIDKSKYVRFTGEMERSSTSVDEMSYSPNPVFKNEKLFLKVLVEGDANLYQYGDNNLIKFFYKTKFTDIQQLICINYVKNASQVSKNEQYKKQLWNSLKCQNISTKDIENLEFKNNNLIRLFVNYNSCQNSTFTNFEKKQEKDLFNLTLRPGLNFSSLSIENSGYTSKNIDFDNELNFRFGIEAEIVMPFNNNKWALLIEPTYQYYSSEKSNRLYPDSSNLLQTQTVKAEYQSIEIPIGIRHYIFLNKNSKLFINGSYILDLSLNSKIEFETMKDLEINSKNNIALGMGYNYNKKYSVELRYQTSRELLSDYMYWNSNYNTFSIIFGYTLF